MRRRFLRSVWRSLGVRSCPTDQQLAGYADRHLIGEERHEIEHHLADCPACARQLAFLVRSSSVVASEVPPMLLSKASGFGRSAALRHVPSWALVAAGTTGAILLLVTAIQHSRQREIAAISSPSSVPSSPAQSKGGFDDDASAMQFRGSQDERSPIVYPAAGQRVGANHLIFRWSATDRTESYEIELLTDSGTLIWSTHVSSLQVALPPSIHLLPSRTYYLKLNIHHKNGTIQHTKAVGFVAE
jgi:hypothetical protein